MKGKDVYNTTRCGLQAALCNLQTKCKMSGCTGYICIRTVAAIIGKERIVQATGMGTHGR